MKRFVFNSSLPRSGSTLLQNILAQNPDFYCTPTSGTLELIYGARANFTNDVTFKAQNSELMKSGFSAFCKHGLNGFYSAITDKPIVLEKSRGWGIHYKLLESILDEPPKIICMVRDIKQILSSLELKFRSNQLIDSGIIDHSNLKNTTTPKRVDHYLSTQPLGLAIERLQEIFRQGINQNMLFIRYEDLCNDPSKQLKTIYSYLNLNHYNHHNFNHIEQKTIEDDSVYGMFGDHSIQSKLNKVDNKPLNILGGDICSWIDNNFKWYNDIFNY
jgi:sulfotransferase